MTKIPWTEQTINPIVGCSKVSPGCENCYAEKMAARLNTMYVSGYSDLIIKNWKWTGRTCFIESVLEKPLRRKKPTMYFVCSMGDILHETVKQWWLHEILNVIHKTPHHRYQWLTKRPENFFNYEWKCSKYGWDYSKRLPENLMFGVTAENQEMAYKRIPILLQIPAAVRFISVEPLLEEISLEKYLTGEKDGVEFKYEDTKKSQTGGRKTDSGSTRWRTGDRQSRQNMETCKKGVGPMEQMCPDEQMQTSPSRTRHRIISDDKSYVEQQTDLRLRTQTCMETLQRSNTDGIDNKPQKRNQEGQSPRQSGISYLQTTSNSLYPCTKEESTPVKSIGRKESHGETDGLTSGTDTTEAHVRGKITVDSGRLRDSIPDGFRYCERTPASIHQIIVGCESGADRRPCRMEWVESVVDQCKAAGVPVFVKQVHDINGKLVKMPDGWPQEFPK